MTSVYKLYDDGTDQEPDEGAIETEDSSFIDKVRYCEDRINKNLEVLYDRVLFLKNRSDPNYYIHLKGYNNLVANFKRALDDAVVRGQQTSNTAEQDLYLSRLESIVQETDHVMGVFARMAPTAMGQAPDPSQNGQGTAPAETAMVVASGDSGTPATPPGQPVQMQNVGAIRAWWDGLSPGAKTTMKAIGIGMLFFGGKMLFDYYVTKKEESKPKIQNRRRRNRRKNPPVVVEDEDLESEE